MVKSQIQAVKGTRDFYPEDMAIRNWIYKNIRTVSESFGYQEWEGPLIEYFDLYVAKSGEDLVKENFVFHDRGGDLISLRPELTPTLARMVTQRQKQLTYPLRWWSFGPFWRYERPQKGREREFFQWNIDIIGVNSVIADAELVAVGVALFNELGLNSDQIQIHVNDRRLIESELKSLAIHQSLHLPVFRLIDRHDKLPFTEWKDYAFEIGLDEKQFYGLTALISNSELWKQSSEMQRFFDTVDSLGISGWVQYDPKIIRGLDYYTGFVFEAWDKDGEFRAILGGGRYENLIRDVGGEPLPGVGFAMGDVIATLVLKKFNCITIETINIPSQVLVTVFNETLLPKSLALATKLRKANFKVSSYLEPSKLSRQLKYGDRMGIPVAVIQGPDEIENKSVTIKNLRSGGQLVVSEDSILDTVNEILSSID